MAKGTEKSSERKLKKLREQLIQFRDNPAKAAGIQGKIITLEKSK